MNQRLRRCRRGIGIEGDDQIVGARACGEGADDDACIGDTVIKYPDLTSAKALVADGQHVFCAVAVGGDGDGERAGVEVG